jgi:hypothetical protein
VSVRHIAKLPSRRVKNKTRIRKSKQALRLQDTAAICPPFRFDNPLDYPSNIDNSDEDDNVSHFDTLHGDFSSIAKPMIEPMTDLLDIPMTPAYTNSEATSPEMTSEISDVYQPLHDRPLSPRTREALYSRLKDDFGPPHGLQESVGTYQAFMNQKARWYLDRLLRSPHQERENYATAFQTTDHEDVFPQSPADTTGNGADFRKWMLFGYAKSFDDEGTRFSLVPDGYPPGLDISPQELDAPTCHSSTSLISDTGRLTPLATLPSDEHLQSIEDLFPKSPTRPEHFDLSELIGSPVLRTESADDTSKDDGKDDRLDEKQTANSEIQHSTKRGIPRLLAFDERTSTGRSPLSSRHLQRGSPQTLPEIKHDVFHEQPATPRHILHMQESNGHNSSAKASPSRSRTPTSASSRSQAIQVMFEKERMNITARLRRMRTNSAGGGI